ncbi:MAG: phage portal protein [Nitrospirales bacterium]|nr:phage portal protein [Nitrospirales bacterium]
MFLSTFQASGLVPVTKAGSVAVRASAQMQELPAVSVGREDDEMRLSLYSKLTWVYVAVSKIARTAAGVPLRAVRTLDNGEEQAIPNDPKVKVIRSPMPPYVSKRFLMEWTIASLMLTGKSYWEVWPSIFNPKFIFPLHPEYTVPVPDRQRYISGFRYVAPKTGEVIPIGVENVVWFRFPSPTDDYDGQSPLRAGSLAASTDLVASKMNLALLFNQGRPSGVLASESPLSKIAFERLQEQFLAKHGGPWKSGKPLILEQGLKYQAVGLPPKDMEYLNGRSFTRDEILALYSVPPTVAGVKSANFATAQIEDRKFWEQAIMPTMSVVTETIDAMMFPDEGVTLKPDYSEVMALQEDKEKREARLEKEFDRGIITRNEYRKAIGYAEDPNGNVFFIKSGLVALGEDGKPETPEPTLPQIEGPSGEDGNDSPGDGEDEKSLIGLTDKAIKLFTQIEVERREGIWKGIDARRVRAEEQFAVDVARLFRGQRERVQTNLEQFINDHPNDPIPMELVFPLNDEIRIFRETILPVHTKAYLRFVREAMRRGQGKEAKATDLETFIDFGVQDEGARNFLSTKAFKFADFVSRTTMELLRRTLGEGFEEGENITSLQERVQETFADTVRSTSSRALAIARTEIGIVQGVGTVDGYREVGIEEHEWLSSGDEVVRGTHRIDGEVVRLGQKFSNGLEHPGDPNGAPGEIINCRCTTLAVIKRR